MRGWSNALSGGFTELLYARVIGLIYLAILFFLPHPLLSQSAANVTSVAQPVSIEIPVNESFNATRELSLFDSLQQITGLSISADVRLNSDTSVVRIILVDRSGVEFQVFESYTLISGVQEFSADSAGEETMSINGNIPSALRIEISDASVLLKKVFLNTGPNRVESRKWQADQNADKIRKINENISRRGEKWVAGETSVSMLTYQEKKQLFGGNIPNLQGFEYYTGGIFVMPGSLQGINSSRKNDSLFIPEYSWRKRHGENWVTPVRNQGNCGSCWAFAATGATELLVNLYYNKHIDYDLAEQQLVSCIEGNCYGGSTGKGMAFVRDKGIITEACFPYVALDLNCSEICSNAPERINVGHYTWFDPTKDDLKELLLRAPVALSIASWNHAVTLVGYKIIKEGDRIYEKTETKDLWFTISAGDPLIGQTAWLVKNSYGPYFGDNGYAYIVVNMNNVINSYVLDGPALSSVYDVRNIRCEDKDEDGYYNWGIGPKPDHCPPCPDQPDGDDSDPCLGPMDVYGHMAPSIPLPPRAKDVTVEVGEPVPSLHANGTNIKWFADSTLTQLIYTGNDFNTRETAGLFTYFATQSTETCESKARRIALNIKVPPPLTSDIEICEGESVIMRAAGENIRWYADSSNIEKDPRDGQEYRTIMTKDLNWMTSNMNYAVPGSHFYLNDSITYHKYGRLYNWQTALAACPDGWSLPSDSQWKDLEKSLGMSQEDANLTGEFRGTNEGNKLKEAGTSHWLINTGNTNESDLSMLPGGEARNNFRDFKDAGTKAGFWTISGIGRTAYAYARELNAVSTRISRLEILKETGLSVRCVQSNEDLKQIASGNDFLTPDIAPGIYNYYVSQEIGGMESEKKRVRLIIRSGNFQPLPDSIDICSGMRIPNLAAQGEQVKWYKDPGLTESVSPENSVPGNYLYHVTRENICGTGIPEDLNILVRQLPEFTLGKDTSLSWREKVTFEIETPYLRYEWNTGTTSPRVEFQGIDLGYGKHTIWLMVTDTNNCTNTDTLELTVLIRTADPGIEEEKLITVFPNPGSGKYTIRLRDHEGENISCIVTDQGGNVMMIKNIPGMKNGRQFNLDLSEFANGIYIIRITGRQLQYLGKIIKTD